MTIAGIERRQFIKVTVGAAGGLVIGLHLPPALNDARAASAVARASAPDVFAPNAFVRIAPDETIRVVVNHSEMGQGVYTSLPMLLADELDADWKTIHYESAPVDPAYNHPVFGMQLTGGSTSTWSGFDQFRKAGALARAMLVAAAAQQWHVDPAACRTEKGVVYRTGSAEKLSYGQLASKAALLKPPENVALKDFKDFQFIGKPLKRLDTAEKIDGSAEFGIDVNLPGMLVAVVARGPVFGATLKTFDAAKASAISGVRKVVQIPSGVAVIADGFWAAKKGRDALQLDWDESSMSDFSSAAQREQYAVLAKEKGLVARNDGDAATALTGATKRFQGIYEVPYLSHCMMEPLNCVVDLRPDSCMIYTGTQFQTGDRAAAAKIAGLPPEKVQIKTTFLGGGFGRRANPASDFVGEAVYVAKAAGAPVKIIWTREDDLHGGYYRPAYYHSLAGAIDSNGHPFAWHHHIVGQSIVAGTFFESAMTKNGIDGTSVEGAADMEYAIPHIHVEYTQTKNHVPVLWWRSVGHSHTAFVKECFLDELAVAGNQDPYQLRRKLLANHPRLLGVLDLAAEKAGWGKPLAAGHGRGIAVHASFGSFNAQVTEVSVDPNGKVRVHRVVSAMDCGTYVNPGIIEAQVEGGAIFGLTAALFDELTFERGRIQQRNFNDYPMLRMNDYPEVEAHIVQNHEKPGGIGEPGVPCAAPALCNAIFAATGKRIRKLPVRLSEVV
jgi:isoquinoline 1-oxidoreductase subunit beta